MRRAAEGEELPMGGCSLCPGMRLGPPSVPTRHRELPQPFPTPPVLPRAGRASQRWVLLILGFFLQVFSCRNPSPALPEHQGPNNAPAPTHRAAGTQHTLSQHRDLHQRWDLHRDPIQQQFHALGQSVMLFIRPEPFPRWRGIQGGRLSTVLNARCAHPGKDAAGGSGCSQPCCVLPASP